MPVSKKNLSFFCSIGFLFSAAGVFGQGEGPTVTAPQAPSISKPSMPTIVAPTLGKGFYVPTNTLNKPYTGTTQKNNDISDNAETNGSNANGNTKGSKNLLQEMFSIAGQTDFPDLGASDNSYRALENYLSQKSAENQSVKLLSFYSNGENILKNSRNIYFSKIQKDGTFIVSGERIVSTGSDYSTEFFTFLFTMLVNPTKYTWYKCTPNVTQEFPDENSPLYKLGQVQNMEANLTGGFISLHHDDGNVTCDLLIDLGNNTPTLTGAKR